jgi:heat shock protein HslJ
MMRWLHVPLLLAVLTLPAMGQDTARNFPLGKAFKVISISGFDVQKAGITLTITPDPQSNRWIGSGNAGCNNWTAGVAIREDQIDIMNVATTRKMCPKPRMTTEEAFLTTLRSAQRWRIDDKNRLIIEGEAARLLLTGSAPDKQPAKKPAK